MLPGQLAFTSLKHPKLEVLIYLSTHLTLTFLLTVAFSSFFVHDIQIPDHLYSFKPQIFFLRNVVHFFLLLNRKLGQMAEDFFFIDILKAPQNSFHSIIKKIITQNLVKKNVHGL